MRLGTYMGAALLILMSLGAREVSAQAPVLTYEAAKRAAEAAEVKARENQWNVTILVVDAAGIPLYLKRMTGAITRSYDFAVGKTRTVLESGLSTAEYSRRIRERTIEPVPNAVALEGGFPILIDGQIVGAIAASGVMPQQDAQVAQAGLDAL